MENAGREEERERAKEKRGSWKDRERSDRKEDERGLRKAGNEAERERDSVHSLFSSVFPR